MNSIEKIIDAEGALDFADEGIEVWYRENVVNVVREVLIFAAQDTCPFCKEGVAVKVQGMRAWHVWPDDSTGACRSSSNRALAAKLKPPGEP